MPKAKVATYPDTKTLLVLMQEYEQMLRDAERAAKKILTLDPGTEKFWDELSDSANFFTMVGDRSDSIWEEIVRLIDQLPED